MIKTLATAVAIALVLAEPAFAHTLDEYLQATLISVEKDHIRVSTRLTPGVAVFPEVFASIDTDSDRVLSKTERWKYAARVLSELSLSIDGHRLQPRLVSVDFSPTEQMKEGLGAIEIVYTASLPGGGAKRRLIFENHHQSRISSYLVNCLVPQDHAIEILAQHRTDDQSFYQLDYAQAGER